MTDRLLETGDQAASWLPRPTQRVHDPELPDLPVVLNPQGARARWGSGNVRTQPLLADVVLTGVHSVRWEPGRFCQVVYRTEEHGGPAPQASFVVLTLEPDGATWQRLCEDAHLPVARLLDDTDIGDRLSCLAGKRDGFAAVPLRYRPGSRCVVRYDLSTPEGERRVYAKMLRSGAGDVAAAIRSLGRAGLAGTHHGGIPPVPPVVAEWDDLGVVVCGEAPGASVSDLLRDVGVPAARRVRLARALGELLARVHAAKDLPAPVRTAEEGLTDVAAALAPAWGCDPVAAPMAASLLATLATAAPRTAIPVLSHGAFRAGQVHAGVAHRPGDPPELRLLDLDGVCWADPGLDLGNALAYLAWQGIRNPSMGNLSRRWAAALVEGYTDGGGRADPEALAWWQATAMVKIAARRYRSLAMAEWPAVPALLRAARAVLDAPSTPDGHPRRGTRGGTVAELVDPRSMTAVLRPALSLVGDLGRYPRVQGVEVMASVGGRRAVVRYAVTGRIPGDIVPIVAKVYADGARAATAFDNQQRLSDALAGTEAAGVPEPLALVRARAMVVYRAVDGVPALDVAADDRPSAAEAAGAALRSLHAADVLLARTLQPEAEADAVRLWARRIGRHVPAVAALCGDVAQRLARAMTDVPLLPGVPVHKDFHAGHVLLAGSRAWILDVDEARMGDPALDVAHFLVHLDAAGWPEVDDARRAFWNGYGDVPGDDAGRRLALFRAWAGLKLARQVVAGSAPERGQARDRAESVVAELLREVSSCLDA